MTKIIDFQKQLKDYPVFSLQDIRNLFPNFSYRQLGRWQSKGYLQSIRRNFYCFMDQIDCEYDLFSIANKIYCPSYISLEKAFEIYNFIPEGVFQVTSVTSRKTIILKTNLSYFSYKHLHPRLFWGYRLINFHNKYIFLAEPEKAILDYLYLKPHLKTEADFQSLRFDTESFKEHVNLNKFKHYLKLFNNQALETRVKNFLNILN